ncbi:MAG: hypothetical protein Q7T78_05020 [Rhodoferax sp.]|nr:hypothetical protein [Rhodoferax sp.]
MLTAELHSSLVYLDRDFVAGKYELVSGQSPSSQITKTQGKKAGASIPVFSAEVSAVETRTFPISTLEMLATVMPLISAEGDLDVSTFKRDMHSQVGWVTGKLGTLTARPSKGVPGTPTYEQGEEQGCFTLQHSSLKLALITTPDYFVSGLDALLKMHKVLLRDLAMPVRAFVRVIAAQSYADQWIAIPYVMHESKDGYQTP